MMDTQMKALLSIAVLGALAGCQGAEDPGIPKSATDSMAAVGKAARDSGGDWERLDAAGKKAVLDRTGGDETAARAMIRQIAGGGGKRGPGSK